MPAVALMCDMDFVCMVAYDCVWICMGIVCLTLGMCFEGIVRLTLGMCLKVSKSCVMFCNWSGGLYESLCQNWRLSCKSKFEGLDI